MEILETRVHDSRCRVCPSRALRIRIPGGGPRLLGYLLVQGRRRDADLDVIDGDEEKIALRFDPRRYLLGWEPESVPRLLMAD